MKKIFAINLFVLLLFQLSYSQTWVRKLDGYSLWSLAKDISGNIYAGVSGTPRCIFKSTNSGNSWDTILFNGVTNFLSIACDSSNCVYAANGSNGLLKSTNCGLNFATIPSSTFGGKNVQTVACGKNGYVYVGCITGGIYRSTDNGQTFQVNVISTLTIVTITIDRFNSNIIYAGASSGTPPNYGFYRSTDGGSTFSDNLNPLNIWGIVQKTNGNLYTITTSTGYNFDKSTNEGLNWTTVSNLTGAMRGLCLDASQNFYASGNGGVWKSTNDGAIFVNFNLTYSANQVISYQNKVFVAVSGTSNGGVWIYTDSLVGIKHINNSIPNIFTLYQNYLNPFNPATKIKFDVPSNVKSERSNVSLIIFDILGGVVVTLVDQQLKPGTYEVEWNASNYPSGIYFYKIKADDFSETKKMILLK
jgi:hypothetical protein